jgi:NADPH-dependent curcumin reductase CurA
VKGVEVHLANRPTGEPRPDDFRLVTVDVPAPAAGQVVVRNLVMSVDPYMRGRMNDVKSYVPPFQLDQVLDGAAVGEVIASGSPELAVGDVVLHQLGWREYAVAEAKQFQKVDPTAAPTPSAFLGVLGMPGLTAYVGLLDIAAMKPGDTVFISGAAGAVGSLAGQIAKLRGAGRVIGSAGSPAKVARLRELGYDAAFDYHAGPVRAGLKEAAPGGIDVYFDNVGGEHLEAAISSLRPHGRVALCGAISQYNATAPVPGPSNLALAVGKRLTLRGFIVFDHGDRMGDFLTEVGGWLRDGKVRFDETVVDGIEAAPQAFIDMLHGANTGKMVVRLAEPGSARA